MQESTQKKDLKKYYDQTPLPGEQARLYAQRVDVDLVYGFVPETSLAGDYIPNKCYY